LGAENGIAKRRGNPLRGFEELQLIRGPTALRTDGASQRFDLQGSAKNIHKRYLTFVLCQNDAQIATLLTTDSSTQTKALERFLQLHRIANLRRRDATRLLGRLTGDAPPPLRALIGREGQMLFRAPRNH